MVAPTRKFLRSPDDCFYKEISAFTRRLLLQGNFCVRPTISPTRKSLRSPDGCFYEDISAFDRRLLLRGNFEVIVLLDASNKFKEKKSVRKHSACGNGDSAAFERAHSLFSCFDKTACYQVLSENGERNDFLTNSKRLKSVGKRFKFLRSPDGCFYKESFTFARRFLLQGNFCVSPTVASTRKFLRSIDGYHYKEISAFDRRLLLRGNFCVRPTVAPTRIFLRTIDDLPYKGYLHSPDGCPYKEFLRL